jgi:hypothetical protein
LRDRGEFAISIV